MKKSLVTLLCSALAIGTLVVGCGSDKGEDKLGGEDEIVIGYASKSATTPYWVQLSEAIEKAAKDAGVTVKEIGPSKENDIAGQISIIEDFYSQDVDALIVAACDDVGVAPAVQKFVDAGKPVIAVDNGITGVDITSLCATNNRESAGAAAEYMAKLLGDEFKVVTVD